MTMSAVDLLTTVSILLLAVAILLLSKELRHLKGKCNSPGVEKSEIFLPVEINSDMKALSLQEPNNRVNETVDVQSSHLDGRTRFIVDSQFLLDCFRYVCKTDLTPGGMPFKESFSYISGLKCDDRTYALTRLLPVKFARQSAVGVRVADSSNIIALSVLDEMGLGLVAHVHSHPGFGPEANHPSSVDHEFQSRLERGGHIAIGAIFSRDGHVRFFAGPSRRFVIEVQGNHIQKVSDHAFQLELSTVADGDIPVDLPGADGQRISL